MWFVDDIVRWLQSAASYFYGLYQVVSGWVWPFSQISPLFSALSTTFTYLANAFYYFGDWVDNIALMILTVLSWDNIKSLIQSWLPNMAAINAWFYNWTGNVTSVIAEWWNVALQVVESWIETARQVLQDQVDTINIVLASLQTAITDLIGQIPDISEIIAWFTDWTGNVTSVITTWWNSLVLDIQGLIDSAFILREGFWEGWQDWKAQVIEFFTDPWQWIYDRMDEYFERFW